MAPHDCLKSGMNLIEVVTHQEQFPNELPNEEQTGSANDQFQQLVLQQIQLLRNNITILICYQLELEQLSQQQAPEEFEQLGQERIQKELEKLKLTNEELKEELQTQQINHQEPLAYTYIRELDHEQQLVALQQKVFRLQKYLQQIQEGNKHRLNQLTQQLKNKQKLLEELTQQKYLQRLQQELQDIQLSVQFQLLKPRINQLWNQQPIPQQTQIQSQDQHVEKFEELKYELNQILVYLQQQQLLNQLEHVQKELYNQQKQYPQKNQENIQLIQQHIDQIKQLKYQPMPERKQLLFLVIVLLRQLILQQQLERIKLQLQMMEFEQQLQFVEEHLDYFEEKLQQQQSEQQLLQLQPIKQQLKDMQHEVKKLIDELEQIRQSLHQQLERPRITRDKIFRKGFKIIKMQYDKLQYQVKLRYYHYPLQEQFRAQLKQVQNGVDKLQQHKGLLPLQI